MALSAIHGIMNNDTVLNNINTTQVTTDNQTAFDSFLSSAIDMYKETDDYQKAAEESEINFALGYSTSTHDLAIAQQKANIVTTECMCCLPTASPARSWPTIPAIRMI